MTEQATQTINIGDKQYTVDELSVRVKRLIAVYQRWAQEAESQQIELAKTQAAIRDLTREIVEAQAADEAAAAQAESTEQAAG